MSFAPATVAAILRVFLDCSSTFCHDDYLREEVELAEYVRDRTDADVHVLVTSADTAAGGEEFTLAFIGLGRFQATARTLKVVTDPGESDDRVRRQLASALTAGLLLYLTSEAVPPDLEVTAQLGTTAKPAIAADDPWKRWIFSLNGNLNLEAEESTSESNWGLSVGADRITPEWKLSIGTERNESKDVFEDLDDGGELTAIRKDWTLRGLVVKSLGEHWSAGGTADVRSSTFDNLETELQLGPAIEWNFFPYSEYTRRQFRVLYSVGAARMVYYEETLFGKFEETRAREELSATYEQNEPWGTLEGSIIASNYFPGFEFHRVEVDTEVDIRIARGLSLQVEGAFSRIRDQLSLPKRDASEEEVLLRLRQLQSGFATRLEIGLEYRFGSAFAAIVNPRFGQ
jgi:hypothetical protein